MPRFVKKIIERFTGFWRSIFGHEVVKDDTKKSSHDNIPRFKYKDLHKGYKNAVITYYKSITEDLTLYRAVSPDVSENDFRPITESPILGEDDPQKIEIDKRSLSFFNTPEACAKMATNKYVRKLETESIEAAERWKESHTHVIKVILTKKDGYTDEFNHKGHLNFAPFNVFNHNKNVVRKDMIRINYPEAIRVGILQGDEMGEYVVLYRNPRARFRISINEDGHEIYSIQNVKTNDLAMYIKRLITLRRLGEKYNVNIPENVSLSSLYQADYSVDEYYILKELRRLNTRDYQNIFERLALRIILGL